MVKGERIELIERDDDFGDGWYLGRHMHGGKTGLFPEGMAVSASRKHSLIDDYSVYTTTTPRATHAFHATHARKSSAGYSSTSNGTTNGTGNDMRPVERASSPSEPVLRAPAPENSGSDVSSPSPLNTSTSSPRTIQESEAASSAQAAMGTALGQRNVANTLHAGPNEASPVMNETLSVIDEHITDMNTPRSSLLADDRRISEHSASEYSSHVDHRLSYIAGQETDEEEEDEDRHMRADVLKWSPEQVARCLKAIGVETRHCDIFQEQEISGEVLLAMDQTAVFMKEFDLGVVGRRLRTWHKIKTWQDELNARHERQKAPPQASKPYHSSEDLKYQETQPTMSVPLPLNLVDGSNSMRDSSPHLRSRSIQSSPSPQTPKIQRSDHLSTPQSFTVRQSESPNRPSAASVREINHARRHSAADFTPKARTPEVRSGNATPMRTLTSAPKSPHKKIPSLDRNWTMAGPSPVGAIRSAPTVINNAMSTGGDGAADLDGDARRLQDLDRGYMSGGDLDSKKSRNVLRKRDAGSASHSRQASNAEEQRGTTSTSRRHSRLPSVESIRDTMNAIKAPASKLYHANSLKGRQREDAATAAAAASAATSNVVNSPVVTRLDYDATSVNKSQTTSQKTESERVTSPGTRSTTSPLSTKASPKPRVGLRAISDAVTSNEKSIMTSPSSIHSSSKDSTVQSPRTGSTTPSAASQSLDLESTDASSKGTVAAPHTTSPTVGTVRRKPKKATSAYTRGLEHKTPQEQMIGSDYCGWMKKKSSNLMTAWKPRLFILRGRRLSYYYSENDDCEKGLIDISYHRVLAADKDTMTSFHATITRTKSSPVSPVGAQTLTTASADAAAIAREPDHPLQKGDTESVFIFKLVPPRTGLSRAVHFTKPTIHYFAVDNVVQGRLWMAALMKAVIDRDETKPITTSYAHKTISLSKARQLKHRPPALMGLEEKLEGVEEAPRSDDHGLNILGVGLDGDRQRSGSFDADSVGGTDVSFKHDAGNGVPAC